METVREDIDLTGWFDWADEGETARVVESTYQSNGRTALLLRGEHGKPIADLTVNLPSVALNDNEIIVNDAAETEEILEPMIEAGLIGEPDRTVQSGFNEYSVCEYTADHDQTTNADSTPDDASNLAP